MQTYLHDQLEYAFARMVALDGNIKGDGVTRVEFADHSWEYKVERGTAGMYTVYIDGHDMGMFMPYNAKMSHTIARRMEQQGLL
jgi:hypothetical protein